MKSLAGRIFLILVVATVVIQVLSFGVVLGYLAQVKRAELYRFMAADLAMSRAVLLEQPAQQRARLIERLDRGFYRLVLQPAGQQNTPHDSGVILETIAPVQQKLGPEVPVRGIQLAPNVYGMEMPIDDVHKLVVSFGGKDPPFAPPPLGVVLGYLALVLLAVMPVAWLAVRLATRPLSRLAAAARALGANLNAPQVPETGTSEVVGAARAFNAMQRAIQKHLDERTQILASISHDLKTPLTRLRLRVGNLAPAEQRQRCEEDIDAMNALVQEGLDYAASAQLRERRVPLDLNRLVEDLSERASDMGQRVSTSGQLAAPYECAPRALERALQNLIDNGVKYGGGAQIVLSDTTDEIEIRVEDNGPGLPEDLLEKTFDPFFRAEQSRSRVTGGTGLGLSIARNLIRAHGGEIRLENRVAGGLAARVTLPRHPAASQRSDRKLSAGSA